MPSSQEILVSIRCTVYNHEPFLRQCLDGFVMQKTNFRFEAIVHDDASTDNSASIIREYAEKYPEIIKPIYETENQYSKHDGSILRIMTAACLGKYFAICEGDDYWTDPLKLQKQIDYLESHPQCTMVFGSAIEHWEDNFRPDKLFSEIEDRDYSGVELSDKWIVPTATIVYRREVFDAPLTLQTVQSGRFFATDLPLCLSCAALGTIHAFSDVFSVYRRLPSGFMRSLDARGRIRMGQERKLIYDFFGKAYRKSTIPMAFYHYQRAWQIARDHHDEPLKKQAVNLLMKLSLRHPDLAFRHLVQIIKERKA